ncbi:hypothetical protein C6A33_00020 [Streptococcus anginosus]|nr:hypothetical protein C6A33_00020 [Streptococcus anginosus]PRT64239.1 hypothetical protein C6A30_09395 [Streptococcus anginosus]PRT76038.1 hypothetical protein C6A26_09145 [Streptococcus anginosus]PRT77030.1 hypothetical protein C6A31_06545 [Streptococcus anginosus]
MDFVANLASKTFLYFVGFASMYHQYNLRLVALSINVLSSKNHDAKGAKNPYENRETIQCLMNTRSFIFFTRILARAQISSLISESFLFCDF